MMPDSFAVNKIELKRILTSFQVSDKNIDILLAQLDKMRRHVNAIVFADMLQKVGLRHNDIVNTLRRAGIDDVTISDIFDALEEERIKSTFGRLIELSVD
jgi:hypothetical protein